MNHFLRTSLAVALGLFVISCKKTKDPAPELQKEKVILIGSQENLYVLDYETGAELWNSYLGVPQPTQMLANELYWMGGFKIADRKLLFYDLYQKPIVTNLNQWSDTLALFAKPNEDELLKRIDVHTGQSVSQAALALKQRFSLPCDEWTPGSFCTNTLWYDWLTAGEGVGILQANRTLGTVKDRRWIASINAVDYQTGKFLWSFETAGRYCTAYVDQGKVFVGDEKKSYALDLRSGKKLEEYNIPGLIPPFKSLRYFRSEGKVTVAEPGSGRILWETPITNSKGDLLVTDDVVVTKLLDSRFLTARNPQNGSVLWEFSSNEIGSFQDTQNVGDVLYVMTAGNNLMAFDLRSGRVLWKTQSFGTPYFQATKEMIYVRPTGGKLMGLDPENGEKIWERFFRRDAGQWIANFKILSKEEVGL